MSSCYWQPFPLDSQLSTPWAENITTFKDALNATISPTYTRPLPSVMRAVDRCWCDFSIGTFFDPFNVSHWEHISIERVKDDLERQQKAEEALKSELELEKKDSHVLAKNGPSMPRTVAPSPSVRAALTATRTGSIWSLLRLNSLGRKSDHSSSLDHAPLTETSQPHDRSSADGAEMGMTGPSYSNANLPLIRKVYDLRPYGLDMLIDFGWMREMS